MSLALSNMPSSWNTAPLRDAADFTRKPRGLVVPESVRFVPMDLIPTNGIHATEWEDRAIDGLTSGTYVEDGDVMVAKITPCFENGKQGILSVGAPFAYATTEVIPLRGKPGTTETLFLHFLLLHPGLRAKLASQMEGSTNRQRLPKEVVEKSVVPIPPLPEQRQIARLLSAVQRAIERQERLIALTVGLKKALMHKLFTEGTRGEPLKQTEIGPVPESWKELRLRDLCSIKHGFAFDGAFFRPVGERILMTPGHFHEEGGFRDQGDRTKFYVGDVPAGYTLLPNDLLIAMTEQKAGLLGSAAFVPEYGTYLHNQRLGLVVSLNVSQLLKEYLFWFLNRPEVKSRIASTATGSKVRHTSPGKILDVVIAIPSLKEQALVSTALESAAAKQKLHERMRDSLSEVFRTLLHQLMTAQVRVHDLDLSAIDEPGR